MTLDFEVTHPGCRKALEETRKIPFSLEFLESGKKEEKEKFKDGCCPDCGGKLYRYAESYFCGEIGYSLPKCEKCKKEFCFIFLSTERIPATGEKEFWELMNQPFTI